MHFFLTIPITRVCPLAIYVNLFFIVISCEIIKHFQFNTLSPVTLRGKFLQGNKYLIGLWSRSELWEQLWESFTWTILGGGKWKTQAQFTLSSRAIFRITCWLKVSCLILSFILSVHLINLRLKTFINLFQKFLSSSTSACI